MSLLHKDLPRAQHCETMTEVRSHIDALDERITALLVERTHYMSQAARIKQGGQPDVLEAAYRALMDASIAFEHREFVRLRQGETV